jgi:hypothetical protein
MTFPGIPLFHTREIRHGQMPAGASLGKWATILGVEQLSWGKSTSHRSE